MPSKGIAVYSYISVEGYTVEFAVPKVSVTNTAADNFSSKHLEVESSNLEGRFNYVGRFEWKVHDPRGSVVGSAFNNINSMTGNLDGGTMTSTVGCVFFDYTQYRLRKHVLIGTRPTSSLSSRIPSSSLTAFTMQAMGKSGFPTRTSAT